jgi:hypothetical protein
MGMKLGILGKIEDNKMFPSVLCKRLHRHIAHWDTFAWKLLNALPKALVIIFGATKTKSRSCFGDNMLGSPIEE